MKTPPETSRNARDFARIITGAAALSMGLTAASLASIRQVNPTVEFKFSLATIVAFLGAGIFTATIFHRVLRSGDAAGDQSSQGRRLALFSIVGIVAMLGSIAFALKDVSRENQRDVLIGAGLAFLVLSAFAWLGWRVVRFLEADEKAGGGGKGEKG